MPCHRYLAYNTQNINKMVMFMVDGSGANIWQVLLFGAAALLIIFIFKPGIKTAFQQSKEAENKDWMGLLLPIGVVVLFVLLLISLV